jgi:hypothetical protein
MVCVDAAMTLNLYSGSEGFEFGYADRDFVVFLSLSRRISYNRYLDACEYCVFPRP